MLNTLTCLIPVYNEGSRLLETVKKLKKVKAIDKLLIVDDGSSDTGVEEVLVRYPHLQIIKLKQNQGKSAAVRTGLAKINTELTLLFDADIRGLIPSEITAGIRAVKTNTTLDMLIFRRLRSPWIARLTRADIMLSGERIIKTTILREALSQTPLPEQYEMEVALNQYCINHHARVYWYPTQMYNTYKILKTGLLKGLWGDCLTVMRGARFIGWGNYIAQIRSFCWNQLPT